MTDEWRTIELRAKNQAGPDPDQPTGTSLVSRLPTAIESMVVLVADGGGKPNGHPIPHTYFQFHELVSVSGGSGSGSHCRPSQAVLPFTALPALNRQVPAFLHMSRTRFLVLLTLIAWLAMIGWDFLLHAGLLAGLYVQPSPFLLPPLSALYLIPVGYLSFLLLAVLLVWLMTRLGLTGWRAGAIFGLELGGLAWGAFVLGLLSISTASVSLLMGWFVAQTLELALAGAVVGSGLGGVRLRRLFGVVTVFVLASVVTVGILQSTGVVPVHRMQ